MGKAGKANTAPAGLRGPALLRDAARAGAPAAHLRRCRSYYIDYCLAQTVALQFFTAFLHDKKDAWRRYLALVGEAGGKTYPGLVAAAGLDSPFAPGTLAKLGKEVGAWIAAQDAALNAR